MDLSGMSQHERDQIKKILSEQDRRSDRKRFFALFPDNGPLRRDLYSKQVAFFKAGKNHRERLLIAANRVGKTESGAFETVCHMIGFYPHWWEGRRFDHPVACWAAGKTNQTARDILQKKFLGPFNNIGTGMIPGNLIRRMSRRAGVPDAIESVIVRHVSGGGSQLIFKSYEQGRDAFMGTEQHVILLDEEPPMNVYTECLTRTMTVNGIVMLTFTPLQGISEVVLAFLPEGRVTDG